MTIYIECIFIENLFMNYVVIKQVAIFTKNRLKKTNLIIGIFLLSLYSVISYIIGGSLITSAVLKILIINFCVYIIFNPNGMKRYFKLIIYFIAISFLLAGTVISITLIFNIDLNNFMLKLITYMISGSLSYLFNKYMWKMWKSNIKKDNLIYDLKIQDMNIPAFVDTGNSVYEYTKKLDVIFIENNYYDVLNENNLLTKNVKININTVVGENICEGYLINNVKVIKGKKEIYEFRRVIFVFVDRTLNYDNEYNALISYETYIDKLKGVELC